MRLSNYLFDERKKRNLTQKQISAELGVVPPTYSMWERGLYWPGDGQIAKLAEYFEIDPKEIENMEAGKKIEPKTNKRAKDHPEEWAKMLLYLDFKQPEKAAEIGRKFFR